MNTVARLPLPQDRHAQNGIGDLDQEGTAQVVNRGETTCRGTCPSCRSA
jgi:hypothetical protein